MEGEIPELPLVFQTVARLNLSEASQAGSAATTGGMSADSDANSKLNPGNNQ